MLAVALTASAAWAAAHAFLPPAAAVAERAPVWQGNRSDPMGGAGAYLAANFAQDVNDVSAAAEYMSIALQNDPGNVELLSRVFILAISSGDMETAVDLAERLQAAAPDHQISAMLLALEDARSRRFQASLERVRSIEPYGIAQFILPLTEAWLHHALGDDAAAMAALDPMAGLSGFASLANLHKGLILDDSGDLEGARQALVEARALGNALRLVQALGSVHERLGQVDEARALYQEYADENPDSLMVEPLLTGLDSGRPSPPLIDDPVDGIAEALFHIATALSQEGAEDIALLMGRMTLHLRPDFPLADLLLAETLIRHERHAEALAVYQSIRPETPVSWAARLSASSVLSLLDRQDEAIGLLREMAGQRADNSGPLVRLGDLLRGESRFDEAITAYDEAHARSPELAESDWSFLYKRGIALERSRQWERAEKDLTRAIDLNPDHAHLLNYLGYSWIDRGENLAEGEELIRRAVALVPNDGYIVDSLGWAYYRTGRIEEAVETLERAVELRSEDAVINDHLGDAYWMVGRRTEARYQWQRALRTAEEEELVLAIEEKLAKGLESPDLIDGPQTAGEPAAAAP